MHLTLRQLLYFVTSIEAQSISRAAEDLHVAPTALSQQIKTLEEHLGTVLLDRHSRGVAPTESGRELYRRARQIIDLAIDTEAALSRSSRAPLRTITLGMPPAIARMVGSEAMLGASRRFAGLRLSIVEGWSDDLFERMLSGELDYVLGYGLPDHPGVGRLDLIDERFAFVAAAQVAGGTGPIDLREALAHDLVFYGRRSVGWRAVRSAAAAIGAEVQVVQEVTSMEVWRELIVQGVGATIVPAGAIGSEFAARGVVMREILGGPVQLRVALTARQEMFQDGQATGFVGYLADVVAQSYSLLGGRFTTFLPGSLPARDA